MFTAEAGEQQEVALAIGNGSRESAQGWHEVEVCRGHIDPRPVQQPPRDLRDSLRSVEE